MVTLSLWGDGQRAINAIGSSRAFWIPLATFSCSNTVTDCTHGWVGLTANLILHIYLSIPYPAAVMDKSQELVQDSAEGSRRFLVESGV